MSKSHYNGRGRTPPDISGMHSIKVDNLSWRTQQEELQKLFSKYGEVGDIHIPRDKKTGQSRRFAFIRFYSEREAERACDSVDGTRVDGQTVHVEMARYGRPFDKGSRERGDRGGGRRRRSHSSRSRSSDRRRSRSTSRSRSRSYSRSRSRSLSKKSRSRSRSRS